MSASNELSLQVCERVDFAIAASRLFSSELPLVTSVTHSAAAAPASSSKGRAAFFLPLSCELLMLH